MQRNSGQFEALHWIIYGNLRMLSGRYLDGLTEMNVINFGWNMQSIIKVMDFHWWSLVVGGTEKCGTFWIQIHSTHCSRELRQRNTTVLTKICTDFLAWVLNKTSSLPFSNYGYGTACYTLFPYHHRIIVSKGNCECLLDVTLQWHAKFSLNICLQCNIWITNMLLMISLCLHTWMIKVFKQAGDKVHKPVCLASVGKIVWSILCL